MVTTRFIEQTPFELVRYKIFLFFKKEVFPVSVHV